MSGSGEFDERLSSLRSQWNRLASWSQQLAAQGHDIAMESDRWFLIALQGIDRGVTLARSGVAEAGQQAIARSKRWLPRIGDGVTPRERIRRAITREAKRQGFEREQLEQFSQNIGLIVELVLSGVVDVEDIAFEHDGTNEPTQDAANEPTQDSAGDAAGGPQPECVSGTPPRSDRLQPAR